MSLAKAEKKSITIDKFDLAQTLLRAKSSSRVTDEDFNTLIKVYEDAIVKDVSSNKYSPTVKITKEQKELLNFGI
ncbi:MAG: hypothetical protein SOY03_12540 [Bariatricus sp.]|uniref:hypothetical protein n=1 Tax=Lachnospiraceae TaxID=186803 RepID=UPI002A86BF71|nr:hypothetical protein [Bariatricus sp.]